jgi:hypothetical protein
VIILAGGGYPTWSWRLGFADLEPGDGLGGGAGDVGDQLVAVVDAEGGVGGLDDHSAPGEADADTDLSRRSRDGTPAGRPTCEDFLYRFKAGPAGGRLRRPSSAGNPPDGTVILLAPCRP